MKSIVIFRHNGADKMYLCADGALSSQIEDAAQHYEMQFPYLVKESFWRFCSGGILSYDYV